MDPGAPVELSLRDYVRVVRRRKWIIAFSASLALGVALAISVLTPPRYRAVGELLIAPKPSETLFSPNGINNRPDPGRAIANETKVLLSRPIQEAVRQKLGFRAKLSVSGSGVDDVLTLKAVSDDPDLAAQIVNTFIDVYVTNRRNASTQDLRTAQTEVQRKIDEIQRDIVAHDNRTDGRETPTAAADRTRLTNQQTLFRDRLDELEVSASLTNGGAQVVTPAVAPDDPFEPQPVRSGILGLALGLILGLGLAIFIDYLDDALRTTSDVERVALGLPVLGVIPTIPESRNDRSTRVVTSTAPMSLAAEAYRSLRTSVQFLALDTPSTVLQLTSPSSGEGKTTTAANLAVALAVAGQDVILVDGDLRRSRLHEFFGLANRTGFTSVLIGETELSKSLQDVAGVPGLRLLASGPMPPNPSELLSSQRTFDLLTALRELADIVVIDSPPVLPVSDAVALAGSVDATLVVVRATSTNSKSLARATALLRQVNAPLVGTVLNAVREADTLQSTYSYDYRPADGRSDKPPRRMPAHSRSPQGRDRGRPKIEPLRPPGPVPVAEQRLPHQGTVGDRT